jgi:hypothetical protein
MEAIESALNHGHYAEAARLINTLDAQDPWALLYKGQLHEAQQDWEQAETLYRDALRQAQGPKITLAARQGIERLRVYRTQARKDAIAQAIAAPEKTELGVLVLEAIAADKTAAAQAMAQVMNIDPYAARILLPSRGMRLYRSGPIGELEFYGQRLRDKGVPAVWRSLSELQLVKVHPVLYFETTRNPVRVIVQSGLTAQQTQSIQFDWADVSQRVEAQLPIFETVLDRDVRGKLLRKEKTQDYAQFCDLHLPQQGCILRLYDAVYQFHQGVALESDTQAPHTLNTSWANWRRLTQLIQQKLPQQTPWADFEPFAQTALDHPELLSKLSPQIDLFRREESDWDPAFQLYSALLFLAQQK